MKLKSPPLYLAALLIFSPFESRSDIRSEAAANHTYEILKDYQPSDTALAIAEKDNRCPIAAALEYLREQPIVAHNPYIVLEVRHRPGAYQQCMAEPDRKMMYCEAASGYYDRKPRRKFTADQLNRIEELGYTPDGSESNFVMERPVSDPKDMYDLSGTLIQVFVKVYKLKTSERLEYNSKNISGHLARSLPGVPECPQDKGNAP